MWGDASCRGGPRNEWRGACPAVRGIKCGRLYMITETNQTRTGYAPVVEGAKYLGLSRAQVYKLVEMGHLKALRLPGSGRKASVRVAWRSVEALEQVA